VAKLYFRKSNITDLDSPVVSHFSTVCIVKDTIIMFASIRPGFLIEQKSKLKTNHIDKL
jgi:hypothetical protein